MKKLDKNVVILGWVSFLTDISSEMLYPIIPIFLTSVLGASMAIVGFIEGIAESTASILKIFSGYWSDKISRRRPFVFAGYGLSSIAKPLLGLSFAWPLALFARFIDRFGKGLRTSARDALIADYTDKEIRGYAFGFHRAMDTAGAVIGPLLAICFIYFFKENYRQLFLWAFLPASLGVLLILKVKEKRPDLPAQAKINISFSGMNPQFKKFLIIWCIFCLGNSSDVFLIMRAKAIGLSTISVILAYALYNLSYSAFSAPFGRLSDKIGRKKVLNIGLLIFALVYAGFAFTKNPAHLWGLFAVYGVFMALTEGTSRALVSDLSRHDMRATSLGAFHALVGICAFLASAIAGLLWTKLGPAAALFYGSCMAGISFMLFALLGK